MASLPENHRDDDREDDHQDEIKKLQEALDDWMLRSAIRGFYR